MPTLTLDLARAGRWTEAIAKPSTSATDPRLKSSACRTQRAEVAPGAMATVGQWIGCSAGDGGAMLTWSAGLTAREKRSLFNLLLMKL
eukprot:1749988-Pleurochrysis_carterae.AAC.4